ncbi:outer membrane receptor protein involved in Fe transport [Flavobacterium sp. HSC-32F16]|uniref:TonB-dependent receptor n=1 Tax=Flavobacterium sp. HSC-32F16 TaxID=2910964 RepID=UPI0020A499E5|nr:TonB-dependent receptor [Flavobacterium sp. HSC-32F16]MCP2025291.1 outer membrane receptor protein involved in Fe transport [Flavobacterium sp. HSC-32F16]
MRAQGIKVLLAFFLITANIYCQNNKAKISGIVFTNTGKPAEGVSVSLKGTSYTDLTNEKGEYQITAAPGNYTLLISSVGFKSKEIEVNIEQSDKKVKNTYIEEDTAALDEVKVTGKSKEQRVREQPFNINSIELNKLYNTSADLNQVLNRSSGIRIRETSGLGGDFNFSVNGLSGKQIKFFIDGIPMENFGSTMSLNNIPINLAERIEVYKGVVPVSLGADALGGAVNIVTNQNINTFLDASYSYGSFNTHRAALSSRYTSEKSGFTIGVNGFYNFSDNNYIMKNVTLSGQSTPRNFRRFNDGFESTMVQVETGFRNRNWADVFLIGFQYADRYKERQTGATQENVFGEVHSSGDFILPSIKYKKDNFLIDGLSANLYASYAVDKNTNTDTSINKYDWNGEVIDTHPNFGEQGSFQIFKYENKFAIARANFSYQLNENNLFSFNYNLSNSTRKGINYYDLSNQESNALDIPNKLNKSIAGLGWENQAFNNRLNTSVFVKNYRLHTYIREAVFYNSTGYKKEESELTNNYFGYGTALRYKLSDNSGIKASFEHTYRIPEVEELLGDGINVLANPKLKPESSNNFNFGAYYKFILQDYHSVAIEANGFIRNAQDFILLLPGGIFSTYSNVGKVDITGFDADIKYHYKAFNASLNASYNDAVNKDKGSSAYLDKLPNQPWLFANGSLGYGKENWLGKNTKIQFDWYSQYIHWFYLTWPSKAFEAGKSRIPTQFIQNASISYSLNNGTYNISLDCTNIFDTEAYDNYKLQKAGRAFYIKLRYFIK